MWHTNNGDRTLDGVEARLFAEALWDFAEGLEIAEGDYDVGLKVFDSLTYGQKAFLLSIIGKGLLVPNEPIRKLTAIVESAIAAVFDHLKISVAIEIDEPDIEGNWRKMILTVRKQEDAEDLPDEDCEDEEEWFIEIEALSYMILWDADYEDEDFYVDMSPEKNQELKELMRIRDDYFLDVPEDPKPKEIKVILSDLKALCRSVCEKYDIE